MKITQLLLTSLPLALAHPGHQESEHQLAYKRQFNAQARRGLDACSEQLAKRGVHQRAQERRAATVAKYRRQYGLQARDTETVLGTSHLSNESYTPDTAETTIFETSNTCVVNPEGETGPYWVKGEYIRSNLRESQTGVPIVIEGQFLDIETCSPLTNVWWDIWNCNATGVYAGVVEQGNGNTADTSNINATFLRGIQQADSDGVVTFESIFPGHYSGRTTHHHMIVHIDADVADNNTLVGGTYAHVGQVFWDQDLIEKVEATSPYSTNTVTLTENADDRVFSTETADTTSDPVFEYVYLGDDLSDGLFGWFTIVVNTSATYDPNYSFALISSGGVAQSGGEESIDGGSGGTSGGPPSGNSTTTGGGPGGNNTMSGSMSGSMTGSFAAPSGSGSVAAPNGSSAPSANPTDSAGAISAASPTDSAVATGSASPTFAATSTATADAAVSASSAASASSTVVASSNSASRSSISTTVLAAGSVGAIGSLLSAIATGSLGFKTSVRGSGVPTGVPDGAPSGVSGGPPFGGPNAGFLHDRPSGSGVPPSELPTRGGASLGVPTAALSAAAVVPTVACSA